MTGVAGCSDDAGSSAEGSAPGASVTAEAPGTPSGEETDGQSTTGGQSTPEEAVATLVTAIIEDDKGRACRVTGTAATGSEPAKPHTAAMCDSDSPDVQQMNKVVDSLRTSFTPEGANGQADTEVAEVAAADGKAVVPGEGITVNGQTLNEIMLSHSTGLTADQLDTAFEVTEVQGAWYVTDMKLGVG
ncbi:hypothetical protein [Streptomyces flavalbus]|uniref:Lipoprotein n=1 Tax=Streptomyces flavalbus TaxID=2665155 RepID=A0ABW2W1Y4_9ACTN